MYPILAHKKAVQAGALGLGLTYLQFPQETEITALGLTAAGVTYAGYVVTNWLIEWPHRRQWVTPLHHALAPAIDDEAHAKRPGRYLKLPRNYQVREGKIMRVKLPMKYAGQKNTEIESILRQKLDLRDATITISSKGRRPYIEVHRRHNPPASAPVDDWMKEIASAAEAAPIIGVAPQRRLVTVDLDAESPHVLMAAGTGGGKSEVMKNIAVQLLHHGAQLVVLDPKRHSHKWAKGLPMVDYYRDTEEIHAALVKLGQIGDHRTRLTDEEDEPDLRRILVIVEEANTLMPRLKKHWDEIKPKGAKTSPAIDALGELMFMGRTARMNVLMLAQSGTVRALGGPRHRRSRRADVHGSHCPHECPHAGSVGHSPRPRRSRDPRELRHPHSRASHDELMADAGTGGCIHPEGDHQGPARRG
ncbi:type IV secretory system conjugative DNA transfer family protein [Streptomyces sp. ISBFB 2968]|uniref:type IV secretory system conjugative DNA transfer family protein n=1 Tax=Streptomyces sp. ISBFB 2968 TaxID=2903527 RepID=UPI002FDC2D68